MTTRPFHHGNLRAVLLEQAEAMLRDSGVDGLSLRELARQAGVSHGAPRSHFIDRRALLDALAEQGFHRLTDRVAAASRQPGAFDQRFRRVAHAYVDFAVDDAALMELMFAAKGDGVADPVRDAAARLFEVLDGAIPASDPIDGEARERFKMLFAASMQGAAALIVSRRVTRAQGDALVDDATEVLLGSELAARVLRGR